MRVMNRELLALLSCCSQDYYCASHNLAAIFELLPRSSEGNFPSTQFQSSCSAQEGCFDGRASLFQNRWRLGLRVRMMRSVADRSTHEEAAAEAMIRRRVICAQDLQCILSPGLYTIVSQCSLHPPAFN